MEERNVNNVEDIEINLVDNSKLIKMYQDVEAFLKFVDEEIKKTDVGDDNGE